MPSLFEQRSTLRSDQCLFFALVDLLIERMDLLIISYELKDSGIPLRHLKQISLDPK